MYKLKQFLSFSCVSIKCIFKSMSTYNIIRNILMMYYGINTQPSFSKDNTDNDYVFILMNYLEFSTKQLTN